MLGFADSNPRLRNAFFGLPHSATPSSATAFGSPSSTTAFGTSSSPACANFGFRRSRMLTKRIMETLSMRSSICCSALPILSRVKPSGVSDRSCGRRLWAS